MWVAINLTGGSLENATAQSFGQTQHVDSTMDACLRRLNGIVLVMDGRSRAGQIPYFIDFHIKWEANVVPYKFESWMPRQMVEITFVASKQIIDTQNFIATADQAVDQMRAEETCAPRYQRPLPSVTSAAFAHKISFSKRKSYQCDWASWMRSEVDNDRAISTQGKPTVASLIWCL
jgi:hypothetical protein